MNKPNDISLLPDSSGEMTDIDAPEAHSADGDVTAHADDTAGSGKIRRSIGRKITRVVLSAVLIAMIGVTGYFIWRQTSQDIETRQAQIVATAQVFAASVAPHVASGDKSRTLHALRAIRHLPAIPYAHIATKDNRKFVALGTAVILSHGDDSTVVEPTVFSLITTTSFPVEVPVINGGRRVGRLLLLADISDLRDRLFEGVLVTFLVALIASLIGILVANRLKNRITTPLKELTFAMAAVRESHDYSAKVARKTDDETGVLVDAFNDMLGQISTRDQELEQHRHHLEDQVEERTKAYRKAKNEAEAANAAKSDFLATMSHEIRTPMNGVMVMAELLANAELMPRQQRYAEVIVRSGQGLLTIINDILDLSKIESGKLELEAVAVDPCRVVDDVLSLFWQRASDKGLDLAAYVDPAIPAEVEADPVRLNQVLSNLVNNALKFTESGHVRVDLTICTHVADNPQLEFSVTDTGIGISQDKIDKIFDAFTQADQNTTRNFGGTGLGLAICKRLVEAMDGKIIAESSEGKGSNFSFCFPLKVVAEANGLFDKSQSDVRTAVIAVNGSATPHVLAEYLRATAVAPIITPDLQLAPAAFGGSQAIIGEAAALEKLAGPLSLTAKKPFIVAISELGDTAAEDLLRKGLADDLIMRPIVQREVANVIAGLKTGAPRGVKALENMTQSAEALPDFGGIRLLVADDNAVNREVIIEALKRLNVKVDVRPDGATAIEAWRNNSYSLIFMDCSMPVMDGFEATRKIRAHESEHGLEKTPIVALTARIAGGKEDEWREAGMDDFVSKPFTLKTIAKTLNRNLGDNPQPLQDEAPPESRPVADPGIIDPQIIAGLRDMAGGNDLLIIRIAKLFAENAPPALEKIEAVATTDDLKALADAAHALKSMCANIGAVRVADAAAELELSAKTGGNIDTAALTGKIALSLKEALGALGDMEKAA